MPELRRACDEAVEVVERAELGVDRVVAALLRADRPRAARVARLRGQRVVRALAAAAADRVDRRQVDDVEAELGELRQHLLDALEPAERAREELVPGAEAPERPVDVELERRRADRAVLVVRRRGEALLDRRGSAMPSSSVALGQLAREVRLARLDLAPQLVAPRRGAVASRPRRGTASGRSRHLERAEEEVVPEELERRRLASASRRARGRGRCAPRISWPSRKTVALDLDACRRRSAWPDGGRSRRPASRS